MLPVLPFSMVVHNILKISSMNTFLSDIKEKSWTAAANIFTEDFPPQTTNVLGWLVID